MEHSGVFSFLDAIDSKLIAFGGGVPIIIFFFAINIKYLSVGSMLFLGIGIYFISIMTAMGLDGLVTDRHGAFIAGVWAPISYCIVASVWLRHDYNKRNKIDKSNYDHLID